MSTPKQGCAECRKTDKPLNQYSFYNILGQQFILFLCNDCVIPFTDDLKAMPVGEQSTFLTSLGQIIKPNTPFKR